MSRFNFIFRGLSIGCRPADARQTAVREFVMRVVCYGLFLLLASLAVGCAPVHIPLTSEDAAKVGPTRVHASITQEEVTAVVGKSYIGLVAGGGMLLAFVDAAVESRWASTANQLIEPIRRDVSDFDFRAQFYAALEKTLRGIATIKLAKFEGTPKPLSDKDRDALRKQIPEPAFLFVETRYELTADFQALWVVTETSLWLRDQEDAVYLAKYHYYTPPIAPAKDSEAAAAAWAANRGAALRAALTEGIAETMKMFRLDLRAAPQPAESSAEEPKFSPGPIPAGAAPFSLTYLAKEKQRSIVRYDDVLYSVSREEVFVPAPAASSP
jgi:hypothetical protein